MGTLEEEECVWGRGKIHLVLDTDEFELTMEHESGMIFQLLEIASNCERRFIAGGKGLRVISMKQ